jgi:hypothetical protein
VDYRRDDARVFLYAFDLIEINGDDLRRDPLEVRKATLALRHVHLLMNVLHRDLLVSARSLALKREQGRLDDGFCGKRRVSGNSP